MEICSFGGSFSLNNDSLAVVAVVVIAEVVVAAVAKAAVTVDVAEEASGIEAVREVVHKELLALGRLEEADCGKEV